MKKTKTLLRMCLLIIVFIIYSDLNAQISFTDITDTTVFHPDTIVGTNYYNLDLNNDGVTDFRIGAEHSNTSEFTNRIYDNYLVIICTEIPNMINTGPYFEGDTIKASNIFRQSNLISGIMDGNKISGDWPAEINSADTFAFIGLEFNHNNTVKYGWVRIKTDGYSFTIDKYALNETPGQLIIAGQTD